LRELAGVPFRPSSFQLSRVHLEHRSLQTQAILGLNFFGQPLPTSLVQLWVPRVELHLFYNTIVPAVVERA
jgi:hypothetical protein